MLLLVNTAVILNYDFLYFQLLLVNIVNS